MPPVSLARLARLFQNAPLAAALRARLRDTENTARHHHLPAPAARLAGFHPRAFFRARTFARFAAVQFRHRNFLFAARRGFFEGDLQIVTQIVAALGAGAFAAAAAKETFKNT